MKGCTFLVFIKKILRKSSNPYYINLEKIFIENNYCQTYINRLTFDARAYFSLYYSKYNKIDSQKKEKDYMKNPTKKIEIQKRTLFLLCRTIVVLLIRIGTDAVLQSSVKDSMDLEYRVLVDQSFEKLLFDGSTETGKEMFQGYETFFVDTLIEERE